MFSEQCSSPQRCGIQDARVRPVYVRRRREGRCRTGGGGALRRAIRERQLVARRRCASRHRACSPCCRVPVTANQITVPGGTSSVTRLPDGARSEGGQRQTTGRRCTVQPPDMASSLALAVEATTIRDSVASPCGYQRSAGVWTGASQSEVSSSSRRSNVIEQPDISSAVT